MFFVNTHKVALLALAVLYEAEGTVQTFLFVDQPISLE